MDGMGWNYSDKVKEHFLHPHNVLDVKEEEYNADGIGYVGSPACGDMMKIFIKVKDDKKFSDFTPLEIHLNNWIIEQLKEKRKHD